MRALILAASMLVPAVAAAQEMSWADAGERLVMEREAGVACARVVKRYVPPHDRPAMERWRAAYDLPRAEMHSALARLDYALIVGAEDEELATLGPRLDGAAGYRERFCADAAALAEKETGEKGVLGDIVAGALGPILEAGLEIWKEWNRMTELERASLRTTLEDAKWPEFDDI